MFENRPWLRILLIVVLAVVLAAVAGTAYKIGERHAGSSNPDTTRLDNESLRHPFGARSGTGFGSYAEAGEDGERGLVLNMGARELGRPHMGLPFARLGMLLIGATLFGMLVLGVVAFFRTGGWRPASANAAQSGRKKRS